MTMFARFSSKSWMRSLVLMTFLSVLPILLLSACGSRVELMSAVKEDDANEIMSTLLNAGVAVNKTVGKAGISLSVSSEQVSKALDVMRAHGLPREQFTGIGTVFRKEGLVSSALEERARYVFALSQELGATLSQIDGVVSARVHVALPERGGITENPLLASASVFIKHKPGISLDVLVPQIRQMVANGIPGLTQDRVAVFMVAAQNAPAAATTDPWDSVMGLHVASDSARGLWIGVVSVLALLCVLCAALGYFVWRFWQDRRAGAALPS